MQARGHRRLATGRTNAVRGVRVAESAGAGQPKEDGASGPREPPPPPRPEHAPAGGEHQAEDEDAGQRRRRSPHREASDEGARRAVQRSAGPGGQEGVRGAQEEMAKRAFETVSRQLKAGSVSLEDLGAALQACGVRLAGDEAGADLQQLRAELLRAQCESSSSHPRPSSCAFSARGELGVFELFLRLARERGARTVLPNIVESCGSEPEVHGVGAEAGGVPLLRLHRLGGTPASRIPTSMSAREHRERVHSSRLGSLTSRDGRSAPASQVPQGPISSERVMKEVQRARAQYVPKSQVPRRGLNIAFKSSEDLKVPAYVCELHS